VAGELLHHIEQTPTDSERRRSGTTAAWTMIRCAFPFADSIA
jgi:hypothetical protein